MRSLVSIGYRHLGLGFSCAALLGCAGGATEAPAEAPVAERAEGHAAPSGEPRGAAPRDTNPITDDDAGDAVSPSSAQPKQAKTDDPNATREVTYVVTPEGLKISVAGVKFSVSASAARAGAGWGVKLSVVSIADDGKPHSLASPKTGPLAFAGTVTRNGKSEPEKFGDERSGDGEQSIFGDDASKFSRTWPSKSMRPLAVGDALDLQVALWGLGANTESRRPLKKFCHVQLIVGKGRPRAVVEPPKDASE